MTRSSSRGISKMLQDIVTRSYELELSISLATLKKCKVGTECGSHCVGGRSLKPIQTRRRVRAIEAVRSSFGIGIALTKACELERIDLKPIAHISHASRLSFHLAKDRYWHFSLLKSHRSPNNPAGQRHRFKLLRSF